MSSLVWDGVGKSGDFLLTEVQNTHQAPAASEEGWWEQWGRRRGQEAACFVAAPFLLIQARQGCSEKTATF